MIEFKKVNERLHEIFMNGEYIGAINNYTGEFRLSHIIDFKGFNGECHRMLADKLDELNGGNNEQ